MHKTLYKTIIMNGIFCKANCSAGVYVYVNVVKILDHATSFFVTMEIVWNIKFHSGNSASLIVNSF